MKNLFLICIFMQLSWASFAQDSFYKEFLSNSNDHAGEITVYDNGDIYFPVLRLNDDTTNSVKIYKLNSLGDTLKTLVIPNTNPYWGTQKMFNLHKCDEGTLLGFGSTNNHPEWYIEDVWVVKLDTALNILSNNTYFTGLSTLNISQTITNYDYDIIYYGSTGDPISNSNQFLFKFNQNGDSLFARILDDTLTSGWEIAWDILQAKDTSGYFLIAEWNQLSYGSGNELVKINNNFEFIELVGQLKANNKTTAYWYSDTTIIVAGLNPTNSTGYFKEFGPSLIDTSCTLLNEYFFSKPDTINFPGAFRCMDLLNDEIFVGSTFNLPFGQIGIEHSWILLTKLDPNFNVLWQKYIGGDNFYMLMSMKVLDDGSCLILGNTNNLNQPTVKYNVFLAKVGPNGQLLSNPETPQSPMEVKIYPNPGSDYFMLDVHVPEKSTLSLFDMGGNLCHTSPIQNGTNTINTQNLLPGMYVFKILNKGKVLLDGKWVKE
ncbi:MAG: T9SS type A sorting domain-containing protein [Bacteroidales bacterium]|nr:T9SS type A sorting domain-containing protein [Bacteroidales bacterium]MCF8455321.1 T9SS type A sorting domain-containing protein [Bacteroidales bacterium]